MCRRPIERAVEVECLPNLDPVGEPAFLELGSEALVDLGAVRRRIQTQDADTSRVWLPQALDRFNDRCLPGAVGAENPEDLALLDAERHSVDDRSAVVTLDQSVHFDDRHVQAP